MSETLDVFLISQPVPFWPSLAHIEPEIEACLLQAFPKTIKISIDQIRTASTAAHCVWVFLPSSSQSVSLSVLKNNFPNAYARPKSIFFLNGEGSKLAHTLAHFRDSFRDDDIFFVACEAEKKAVLKWTRGLESRIFVCPYPVRTKWFNTKKPNRSRKSFSLPVKKKLILYSGRLSEQKNILSLLEYVFQNNDYDLVLAGDIDSFGFPHLRSQPRRHFPFEIAKKILALKLSSRVHFIPFLAQQELSELMKLCDVQISLSTHYGEDFGYSIAQGLSCGLPTIMTNWGGHRTWKDLKQSVYFVQPIFEKNQKSRELKTTPLLKIPKKFPKKKPAAIGMFLNTEVKRVLKSAIEAKNFKGKQLHISTIISNYWGRQKKKPSSHMFLSTKEEIYQYVLHFYGAKQKSFYHSDSISEMNNRS